MCGIFGFTNYRDSCLKFARAALARLSHRGPDSISDWHDHSVYTGHTRLSIIDLSPRGTQPMLDSNTKVSIAVNGEIYNYRELKRALEGKYKFQSQSDSEVILHGYTEWGIDGLLEKLEGMYGFCVYDAARRQIHLVRDRAGIKPLYYAHIGGSLIWASELKALIAYLEPHVLRLDHTAFYDFLTYRYVPAPKTMYMNISKLEPSSVLTYDIEKQGISMRRYWRLEPQVEGWTLETAEEAFREEFGKAVLDQMVADVPVGFFLSGGIDSSAVVAAAKDVSADLETFCIGFRGSRRNESSYADIVARQFETRHSLEELEDSQVKKLSRRMRDLYDEPFADSSAIPTCLVCANAASKVKVVLTGDGADELFGGYPWYRRDKFDGIHSGPRGSPASNPTSWASGLWNRSSFNSLLRPLQRPSHFEGFEYYVKEMGGLIARDKKSYAKLWNIPQDYDDYWYLRKYYRQDLTVRTRLQYMDFHTFLPDDILTKVDRASMAVSLEARVPFLATRLIEFAFSLPEDIRFLDGAPKGFLKHCLRGILPPEILNRPKRGFGLPRRSIFDTIASCGLTPGERMLKSLYPECLESIVGN